MGEYAQFEVSSAAEILAWAMATFGDAFAIATSFQKEGMAIVDIASRLGSPVRVFTLDTGRLPEETYRMMETVRERYGIAVEAVFPDSGELERMVAERGPNLFYDSLESRRLCCEVRKVRPFERKLRELRAWAAGLRREQSETRSEVDKVERLDGRVRICPLADWTSGQVDRYIADNGVPVHPLYERGYASIGCAPCTRPVGPGEDERAGRWWWEQDARKECGIHFTAEGLVRRG
ncbi:Thioredoxin-dependent 5'-adenylylsulfate reductase [Candidatus Sulfopaludibacter sp. SbA4]|nr:Thioredoxin-dependent 5'-adenylylsulfate reductase [Candidatus Sulfopaludibacter sp. SbA4]